MVKTVSTTCDQERRWSLSPFIPCIALSCNHCLTSDLCWLVCSFFLGCVSVYKNRFMNDSYNLEMWVNCLFHQSVKTDKNVKYFTYTYFMQSQKESSQETPTALPHGGCHFEILMAQLSQPWNRSMATCQPELHNVGWGEAWRDEWGPSDFVTAYLPKVSHQKVFQWKLLPLWTRVPFIAECILHANVILRH